MAIQKRTDNNNDIIIIATTTILILRTMRVEIVVIKGARIAITNHSISHNGKGKLITTTIIAMIRITVRITTNSHTNNTNADIN